MIPLLAHFRPLDLRTNERVDVYVCSVPSPAYAGLGGIEWEPAIIRRPRWSMDLMPLDFSTGFRSPRCDMEISFAQIHNVAAADLLWGGAPVEIYRADELAWPIAASEFSGNVEANGASRNLETDSLSLAMITDLSPLEKDLLTESFSGDNGAGGDADKRGTLKPLGLGVCKNIEPVFFDTIRNIAMLDGYGNLESVQWVGEGLSSLGASAGDYPDYATLAAAIDRKEVKPGQWATSIAGGLLGLGAPPAGVITCHATFAKRCTGEIMRHLLEIHAQVPLEKIDVDSFAALDEAVPGQIRLWLNAQRGIRELLEALGNACNAWPLVTMQGRYAVARVFGGGVVGSFVRNGFNEVPYTDWKTNDTISPFWQLKLRTARPVRVMNYDEVLYEDDLVLRGLYSAAETYRNGHRVWTADGAEWLYIGSDPSTDRAPPVDAVEDAYWRQLKPPTTDQVARAYSEAVAVDPTRKYKRGDVVKDQNARWIYSTALAWNGTLPPALPAESNTYWTLLKDAQVVTIRANTPSIAVEANAQGTVNAGQLPAGGRGILTVGTVDISDKVAWTVTTSGCTAEIDATGSFTITAITATGYVDLKAAYGGINYTARVAVTLNRSGDTGAGNGGGGSGGTATAEIMSFPNVSMSTYPSAPATTANLTTTGTSITFTGSLYYTAALSAGGKAQGNAILYAKVVYRVKDSGSGWTDAAPETVGSEATANGYPEYDTIDGGLDFAFSVTGLVAATAYEFGVLLRRTGNSGTNPYGSVKGATA